MDSTSLCKLLIILMTTKLVQASQPQPYGQCEFPAVERTNCGGGMTKQECMGLGCCHDNSIIGVKWCFYKRFGWMTANFILEANKYAVGDVYSTFYGVVNKARCGYYCQNDHTCVGFNHHGDQHICELLSSVTSVNNQAGWRYGHR